MSRNKLSRVAILIACHNEKRTIEKSVNSLMQQTYKPKQIICVDDASDDGTYEILLKLKRKIKRLNVFRCNKKKLKAGALNFGLKKIKRDISYVLTMDADTRLKNDLIERGLEYFRKYNNLGGVCSKAGLKKGKGFLYRLQKLEYGAGFDAERTATFENVMILHGMCTLFDKNALRKVGGFTLNHLIEDYDVTLKLKKTGFRTMYNPRMEAFTIPPGNFRSLIRQRLRWSRGGVDIILQHGINRHTLDDFVDHIFFIILFLLMLVVIISSLMSWVIWHYRPHPVALALGFITYFIHIYSLKFIKKLEWKDFLLRLVIFPELILSMILSGIQLWAYMLAFTGRKRRW